MEDSTDDLLAEVLFSRLFAHKIFGRNELQPFMEGCHTDQNATHSAQRNQKKGAWDCFVGFLRNNTDRKSVELPNPEYIEIASELSCMSTSTADSSHFHCASEGQLECEPTVMQALTSNDLDQLVESATVETTHNEIISEAVCRTVPIMPDVSAETEASRNIVVEVDIHTTYEAHLQTEEFYCPTEQLELVTSVVDYQYNCEADPTSVTSVYVDNNSNTLATAETTYDHVIIEAVSGANPTYSTEGTKAQPSFDLEREYNQRRRLALDKLMTQLQQGLRGGLEPFVTHLQRQKVISLEDWQIVSRRYDSDKSKIFHLLNVLVWKDGSWEEILVFLYDSNRSTLAKNLQSAAEEPIVQPRPNVEDFVTAETDENDVDIVAVGSEHKVENDLCINLPATSKSCLQDNFVAKQSESVESLAEYQLASSTSETTADSSVEETFQSELKTISRAIDDKTDLVERIGPYLSVEVELLPVQQTIFHPTTSSSSGLQIDSAEKQLWSDKSEVEADLIFCLFADDFVEFLISTLSDRFDKSSPSKLLPDVIMLMRNQTENVRMQMGCHRLIDQYSSDQLERLESPLKRSLIEVLLSVVKRHDSLIVKGFCDLLMKINIDQSEIVLYLGAIDCILEIICDENKLTTTARKSALKLLREIAYKSGENQRNLLGEKFIEKICRSIRHQLDKSEYDEIMEISWDCLFMICCESVPNKKRFLDAGGLSLFQQCYKKFNNQTELVFTMTWLMRNLSKEKSFRQELMADGNLAILWEIWRETNNSWTISGCSEIFSFFLSVSIANWPLGHPTIEEVKKKLGRN